MLWQTGGNFKGTLPSPDHVSAALGRIKLRVHQDIVVSPTMLVDPAETVVLLPSRTRYEQRGGGTETSTERRVIFSPEILGPRPGEARDEWEIPMMLAKAVDPQRAATAFHWNDTQDIREEIEKVCPTYSGIAALHKKGDNFQYGGPRLLQQTFPTSDEKGHFSAVAIPKTTADVSKFALGTRRGKQFNSMVHAETDPLNAAARDHILISREDAVSLHLRNNDPLVLRNELGEFHGRALVANIKPGSLQGHWPEINILLPAGRCDASGVPDYNTTVEVVRSAPAVRAKAGAAGE